MHIRLSKKAKQRRLARVVASGVLAGGMVLSSSVMDVASAAAQTTADAEAAQSTKDTVTAAAPTAGGTQKESAAVQEPVSRGNFSSSVVQHQMKQAVQTTSVPLEKDYGTLTGPPKWLELRTNRTNYSKISIAGGGSELYILAGAGSNLNNTEFRTYRIGGDGGEMGILVLNPNDSLDEEHGMVAYLASIKDSAAVADFTGSTFNCEGGDIAFLTGTAITNASAFQRADGEIHIGAGAMWRAVNAHATVKLQGNTAFNTSLAQNHIVLNPRGILEAESAQLFTSGLGNGLIQDPGAVRSDVNNAVNFQAGTVLLDDPIYNANYLARALVLIQNAEGSFNSNIQVEMNQKAALSKDPVAIGDLTNAAVFGPVKADKTDITIGAGGDSAIDIFNAQSLNLQSPASGNRNSITVDGKVLHLGSSYDGQQLLTAGNDTPELPMTLNVKNQGVLKLGTGNAKNTLDANVTLGTDQSSTDTTTMIVSNGMQIVNDNPNPPAMLGRME